MKISVSISVLFLAQTTLLCAGQIHQSRPTETNGQKFIYMQEDNNLKPFINRDDLRIVSITNNSDTEKNSEAPTAITLLAGLKWAEENYPATSLLGKKPGQRGRPTLESKGT